MMKLPHELRALADRLRALTPEQQAEAIGRMAPSQAHAIMAAIMDQPLLKATMGASWKPNPKQVEARASLDDPSLLHVCFYGGARSGKSVLGVKKLVERAIEAPGSRHLIARHRFAHVKQSIWRDTLPKVMQIAFPGLEVKWNQADFFIELLNGSQIWIGGLDSQERSEKILGTEFASALLEECSELSWATVELVRTRVAQKVGLPLQMIYTMNPPGKVHWSYRVFIEKRDPEPPHKPLANPERYAAIQINPVDNAENLDPLYIEGLQSGSARQILRFLKGQFGDAGESALWTSETLEKFRVKKAPPFQKIGVAVDPSGTRGGDGRDYVGIIVGGLGLDGHCYIIEDASVQAPPAVWGRVVMGCVERYDADFVCIETNFGGAQATNVVEVAAADAGRRVQIKEVTASRGKVVRADDVAALYENGRVHHVGQLMELEDQMLSFTTAGYLGSGSPDRADAAIWIVNAFFPRVLRDARDDSASKALPRQRRDRERPKFANLGYSSTKKWTRERPTYYRPPGKPYA